MNLTSIHLSGFALFCTIDWEAGEIEHIDGTIATFSPGLTTNYHHALAKAVCVGADLHHQWRRFLDLRLTNDPVDDEPAVWLGTLSDYNDGNLHGCWVRLDMGREHLDERWALIRATSPARLSGHSLSEEWYIGDWNAVPGPAGAWTSPWTVLDRVEAIEDLDWYGSAAQRRALWDAFLDTGNDDPEDFADWVDEARPQCCEGEKAWAEEYIEDEVIPGKLADQPYYYFDVDAWLRDQPVSFYAVEGGGYVVCWAV